MNRRPESSREIEWCSINPELQFSRYPVTVGQFRSFMEDGGYLTDDYWSVQGLIWRRQSGVRNPSYWDNPNYVGDEYFPVTGVCFWEAEAFASWVGARLPSEAEWEFVATNGGVDDQPWGMESVTPDRAHFTSFLEPTRLVRVDFHLKGASKFGVIDLIGNVCEWTYGDDNHRLDHSYTAILKGGSSWHTAENLGPRFRDVASLDRRDNDTGIRLAKGAALNSAGHHRPATGKAKLYPSRSNRPYARPTAAFRQEGMPDYRTLQNYSLTIEGEDGSSKDYTGTSDAIVRQLEQCFEVIQDEGFLTCVCKWCAYVKVKGVRISDLVQSACISSRSKQLFLNFRSMKGRSGKCYETSWKFDVAHEHNALLVFEMNGKMLSPEDGYPFRTVDFHTFGYKHVKALERISISKLPKPGWWESSKGYSLDGTIMPGTYTVAGDPSQCLDIMESGRIYLG